MVFDEAHEIEDVAGQYFGVAISNYRFQELRRDISAVGRMKKFGSPELDRILDRLDEIATAVLRPFRRGGAPGRFPEPRRLSRRQPGDLLGPADCPGPGRLATEGC